MPEYLAPGVYVEETSFRQKTIEGVSTSTAGFVGPTRFGPVDGEPELLTNYFEFERIYGGIDPLEFEGTTIPNDLAHAVRGFFENGGQRLYVSRTYTEVASDDEDDEDAPPAGVAAVVIGAGDDGEGGTVRVRARHPGAAGNIDVTFELRAGPNILTTRGGEPHLSGAAGHDTVLVLARPPGEGGEAPAVTAPGLYWLEEHLDLDTQRTTFRLCRPDDGEADPLLVADLDELDEPEVRVVTLVVSARPLGRFMDERTWEELAPDPRHRKDPFGTQFAAEPTRRATHLYVPLVIETPDGQPIADGVTLVEGLFVGLADEDGTVAAAIRDRLAPLPPAPPEGEEEEGDEDGEEDEEDEEDEGGGALAAPERETRVRHRVRLIGGNDGRRPGLQIYQGSADAKTGLLAFEDLEDVSIVAAPGSTRDGLNGRRTVAAGIQQALIAHCERMRYRIAVLDSPDGALVGGIRQYRAMMDSTHAALYYPWVRIVDPLTGAETTTPPSGFVAGVYARNDVERGVHKSPANEVVRLAIGFEQSISKGQQDVLNPEGINALRFFEGRGMRIWGARTITSDPEWRYVALRRYFAFLQRSIDKGTQWAVFEPNGHLLWSKVRRTIEDFLFNEWSSGHLMGESIDEAFFVKCDRSTMTQNDFDNGRLICLIGVAPLRPAEFVIFRIGQKTLDSRG